MNTVTIGYTLSAAGLLIGLGWDYFSSIKFPWYGMFEELKALRLLRDKYGYFSGVTYIIISIIILLGGLALFLFYDRVHGTYFGVGLNAFFAVFALAHGLFNNQKAKKRRRDQIAWLDRLALEKDRNIEDLNDIFAELGHMHTIRDRSFYSMFGHVYIQHADTKRFGDTLRHMTALNAVQPLRVKLRERSLMPEAMRFDGK